MVDLAAYVGYRLRGVPGALMAALGFVLPSFVLMLVLSAAYFAAGSLPWVHALFLGLEALVVGVILNITLDFGQRAIRGKVEAAIALGAFVAMLFKLNAVVIVLAALGLGAWLLRPAALSAKPSARPSQPASAHTPAARWVAIGSVVAFILAIAGVSLALRSDVGQMGLSFLKIGSIAFGNGTTIAPLIQAEAVDGHNWLSLSQFADGIALGQVTPGPFLITAAFVGYKVGGITAAALATFGIFAPLRHDPDLHRGHRPGARSQRRQGRAPVYWLRSWGCWPWLPGNWARWACRDQHRWRWRQQPSPVCAISSWTWFWSSSVVWSCGPGAWLLG